MHKPFGKKEKEKKPKKRLRRSLYLELFFAVTGCFVISAAAFFAMLYGGDKVVDSAWLKEHFIEPQNEKLVEELQDYVTENKLSSKDVDQLSDWTPSHGEKNRIYIEYAVFSKDGMIYNSLGIEDYSYDMDYTKYYILTFSDGDFRLSWYSTLENIYYNTVGWAALLSCCLLFIVLFVLVIRRKIRYIDELDSAIHVLESGNLDYAVPEKGQDELHSLAVSLNAMRGGISERIKKEEAAIQANNSLVTALSHDIRTPLTALIGYLEILRDHRYATEEEGEKYFDKCLENSYQLKDMTNRLFEYFLAYDTSTVSLHNLEPVDALEMFIMLITSRAMVLEERGFTFSITEPEEQFFVEVNSADMMRVFDNLFSNIAKYAASDTTVTIEISRDETSCCLRIRNRISRIPAQNESAKVGIESMKALMRRQNGTFSFENKDDCFTAEIVLPVYKPKAERGS